MSEDRHRAVAVIVQAIADATGGNDSKLYPTDVHEAWRFLTDEEGDWHQSRAFWCEMAGSDPDYIRRKALAMQDRHDAIMHKLNARVDALEDARLARLEDRRAAKRKEREEYSPGSGAPAWAEYQRRETERRTGEYVALLVAEIARRIDAGEPGPTSGDLAHLWRMHRHSVAWWLARIAPLNAVSWRGRKTVVWRLPDGRETLPSKPARNRKGPRK